LTTFPELVLKSVPHLFLMMKNKPQRHYALTITDVLLNLNQVNESGDALNQINRIPQRNSKKTMDALWSGSLILARPTTATK